MRKRIGEHEAADPLRELPVAFESDLSSHRKPTENKSVNADSVDKFCDVRSELRK